jgi:hypothetical protein
MGARNCSMSSSDTRGYGYREYSLWKGTSVRGAGEVPTRGAVTEGAEAEAAMIGVVSEGGDVDGTDAGAVRRRVEECPAKRGDRKHVLGRCKPT